MTDFNEKDKPGFIAKVATSGDKASFADKVEKPLDPEDNSFTSRILNKTYQDNLRGMSRPNYPQCSHLKVEFRKCG
jgi:hypothetical protein